MRQCKLNPATPHFESNLYFMDCRLEHSISQPSNHEMDSLKEFIKPKTFHKLSYVTNGFWIVICGIILLAIFVDIGTAESRFDFKCTAKSDVKDVIQGKCFDQYQQRNKLGIPVYAFVLINFLVIEIVIVAYSQIVASRVERNADGEGQDQQNSQSRRLFLAYFMQLSARLCLLIGLTLLQTLLLYPSKFPSNFQCYLMREGGNKTATPPVANITQTQTYECHNARAAKKTFWTYAITVVNGIFALFVLIEIIWILSRAIKRKKFMEDQTFVKDHLGQDSRQDTDHERNQETPQELQQRVLDQLQSEGRHEQSQLNQDSREDEIDEQNPQELEMGHHESQDKRNQGTSHEPQQQELVEHVQSEVRHEHVSQLLAFVTSLKASVKKHTEDLTDLAAPFRPKPGESDKDIKHDDLKLDEIYVNLVLHTDRVQYHFTGDRQQQLKLYPQANDPSKLVQLKEITNSLHKKVLVVGRPGIGKTIVCTKIFRNWASDIVFNEAQNVEMHYDVAFLLKFRRLNFDTNLELNLRELLRDHSEYPTEECLNDEVWNYIVKNPTEVLLIFDGLDEFAANSDIAGDYKNTVLEEKMPLHALYNKIASGKLLNGAKVITTTRPNRVECVQHLKFDRTFEIVGFSSEQVQEYVVKFTKPDGRARERIWQHISTNINLFSLCYIPVNCFIICSCLLLLHSCGFSLPTKLTDIYKIAIKFFFFRHNPEYRSDLRYAKRYSTEPFHKIPSDVQEAFKELGKIAFDGIKESRLIFGSSEVEELENCGLLHQLPDTPGATPVERREEQFCFLHLTIQEFLAAKHLTDTMNDKELRKFVANHIKDGKWHMVMQFVAGLLGDRTEPPTDMFTDLLPESTEEKKEWWLTMMADEDSEPRTLTCWPAEGDKHLAVRICNCLNEMLKVDDSAKVKNSGVQAKLGKIGFNAVDFSRCSLAPVDCAAIVHVLQHVDAGILCMDLHDNNIGDLRCKEIQKFIVNSDHSKSNYKLNSLNLGENGITDAGVKHLAEALTNNNCKINTLNLSYNHRITDAGVKHLAEALTNNNCKINTLNLSNNRSITDAGVKHLAEALINNNCKINTLNLRYNRSINRCRCKAFG